MQRGARIEIDLDALTHNLSVVRQYSNNAKIISVIKANAYGHGMLTVARHLKDKVDALAVACVDEALALRAEGISITIVVLQGFHNQNELEKCFEKDLQPVCHQSWQIDLLSQQNLNNKINCWLKIDTGMHRLGISASETASRVNQLQSLACINEVRLMSHFANADDVGSSDNKNQLETFNSCTDSLNLEMSLANSAAILSIPDSIKQWVRPGLMLYGASPFPNKSSLELGLKPVMTLKSHIIAINQVAAGQSVGYGSRWVSTQDCKIAVVAIGYGDGYPRHAKNGTSVSIMGQRCELVGRVSMDMITIDVTDVVSRVVIGTEVVLWGSDNDVVSVAQSSDTIAYELLCNTGKYQ